MIACVLQTMGHGLQKSWFQEIYKVTIIVIIIIDGDFVLLFVVFVD